MLNKSEAELEGCKDLAASRLGEIKAKDVVISLYEQSLIPRLEKIIKDADEQIRLLKEQKCSTFSVFFGLLKWKKC